MTIYVVENYDSNEYEAFEELEQAATYVRKYYIDHLTDFFSKYHDSVESVLKTIKTDLENLNAGYPYIEDLMYIHDATLMINK